MARLLGPDGIDLQYRDVRLVAKRYATVSDVVHWRWDAPGRVSFECQSIKYPMATNAADHFKVICICLVVNYPSFFYAREIHSWSPLMVHRA